jgi:tetratricopeptide (TPR) repeat protein
VVAVAQKTATVAPANDIVREQLAEGDKATVARLPRVALSHFERALQADPRNYEALWKASGAEIDLSEVEADDKKSDAMFTRAIDYANRSVEVNADGADGYFSVARALGRKAQSVGPRDRVKYATEVRANALKALALDPKHPGALHVMGVWNAEVMRLNGLTRLLARTLMGGSVFGEASWDAAVKYIDESVTFDPERTVHHLDQARIYRDIGRKADARAAYEAALKCPLIEPNDELYKKEAAAELRAMN